MRLSLVCLFVIFIVVAIHVDSGEAGWGRRSFRFRLRRIGSAIRRVVRVRSVVRSIRFSRAMIRVRRVTDKIKQIVKPPPEPEESAEEPETPPPSCTTPQVTEIYKCCQITCYEGEKGCETDCSEDAVVCQSRRKRHVDDFEEEWMFEEVDTNSDGLISVNELAVALNVDPEDEEVLQAMQADTDGDGMLNRREFDQLDPSVNLGSSSEEDLEEKLKEDMKQAEENEE